MKKEIIKELIMPTSFGFFVFGIMIWTLLILGYVDIKFDKSPDYTIYAVDEDGIRQVDKFVVVPNSSITCPNDLKLQEPRYIFIEAEK